MSPTPASYHLSETTALPEQRPTPRYRLRLADGADDVRAAQALRFAVFNLELNEGLPQSYDTGLDADPFDEVCDHLLVEDAQSGAIVGTYRLQTGLRAGAARGYYSEREFDFSPFEAARPLILELGRACIHQRHRHFAVLNLLWSGIASYAHEQGARYLVGCSSLNSQDAGEGWAAYRAMARHLAPPAWRTQPRNAFVCPHSPQPAAAPRLPRLLSAYLALGAEICGPPAIDREFRTIDFLTLLDLHSPGVMALQARGRFAG
ncbi:GNAT family N-acetyltransferase [Ideonella sp. 4Y16]|uniref:L-ornithine N(alpha)-acyltransferase n=1 Tax=Ideonella alba TaxID=2824118 RepID=A0A940YG37_9BURK|nr:GNAT family N-acyltransferase [Ideonella alba]MBQ0929339.1 GNAT family N-acetyltransferase [Ideonella alba]MBQ0945449.1 GNAT family N-acetyltransferase [Ideonella alba]